VKTVAGFVVGLVFGVVFQAGAIKPGACTDELEQVRTDLRLRTGELLVARGQLKACERRTK
jgi:hypothetical protein